jgi:hypothetical protein
MPPLRKLINFIEVGHFHVLAFTSNLIGSIKGPLVSFGFGAMALCGGGGADLDFEKHRWFAFADFISSRW